MWIIVAFIDDYIAAVPISWVKSCNRQTQCWWPLQDERRKRSQNEIPTSFEMHEWELHECVVLLNGAIYDDFEEALEIEMGDTDINDVSTSDRPKISWNEPKDNSEVSIANKPQEIVYDDDISFGEFASFLDNQHLCSSAIDSMNFLKEADFDWENSASVVSETENQLNADVDMLDSIINNQEEKKKVFGKLMARMYSLESAVGYKPS